MTSLNTAAIGTVERARVHADRRWVRVWLALVMLAIFALVIVGGVTRMTHSGLSMTTWHPIHGVIPPLNHAQWQQEFDLYKRIPEYKQLNQGMTLAQFKGIFWWEWTHRLLARSVGLIFALPFFSFWIAGKLENRLKLPLFGILLLGGLQGLVGWWMVSSGLAVRTDVSQYRLAAHLTLGCFIFAAIAWVLRGLAPRSPDAPAPRGLIVLGGVMTLFLFLQIYLGGLVSGLDAGMSYNTWPLMDGAIIPGHMFPMTPLWHNFFANPKLVQFMHRMNAYLVWTIALVQMIATLAMVPASRHANRAVGLFVVVTIQAALGITTLLLRVPMDVAIVHQGWAIVLLACTVIHWRGLVGEYLLPREAAAGAA